MRQYLDAVKKILSEGTRKENRTGVDSISRFNINYEIDLSDGFPLLTTKKISWKNIVVENLWFLSGEPHIGFLQKHGCKFWDAWADKDGKVPSAYGHYWTAFPAERVVQVERRLREPPGNQRGGVVRKFDKRDGVGGRFADEGSRASKTCGTFLVLEETGRDQSGRSLHTVQFEATGYVVENVRADVIQNGQLRDPWYPVVCGIGYVGDAEINTELNKNLRKTWQHMLERCYDRNCKEYEFYGEQGVFVDDSWLCFSEFLKDASRLPNWISKRSDLRAYQLDKDYYGSNCYSVDTCVWLSKKDNRTYQKNSRAIEITTPEGETHIELSQSRAAEFIGVTTTCAGDVLRGKQKQTNGHTLRFLDESKKLWRYGLPNNQITWVVDELRRNPMSRRLVVSAWAPGNAQTSKLPPCHALMVFNVQNLPLRKAILPGEGTYCNGDGQCTRWVRKEQVHCIEHGGEPETAPHLCLHLTQRSCDIALGVPYNIAGYAFLLELFARFANLKPGIFAHTLVDAHAYTRKPDGSAADMDHLPGLYEQLEREVRPLPKLVIDPSIRELEDINKLLTVDTEEVMSKFVLHGYDPHPAIKFKVAV